MPLPFCSLKQHAFCSHITLHSSPMKDYSLFLLKNSLALKMKRGIKSFCNGVASTSTLNQRKADQDISCIAAPSLSGCGTPLTLEEMILQLDLEEEAARRTKLDDYSELHRRMSCVNNSDILRSARNAAMNQYPRFSLDGRDAMYRSSFRNLGGGYEGGRRSVCCSSGFRGRSWVDGYKVDVERNVELPPTVAGESVIWCKPGIVAKLMGLDAVPVPVGGGHGKRKLNPMVTRKQNLRRMGRQELEKVRLVMGLQRCREGARREGLGSCSGAKYCELKPATIQRRDDWRFTRAR